MASKNSQLQALSSFCQNSSSIKTKVALLTYYKVRYSPWAEKLILIFEYLQLVSQAILSASFASENTSKDRFVFTVIIYALKLINPSYFLNYEDSMTSSVLVILFCCTWLKLSLFFYVLYASMRDLKMNSWLLRLWRWTYRLQTRVVYFLFTSFWVKLMVEAKERDFRLFGMHNSPIIFIASMMLAVEFLFSLVLETQLCYFLPTKNFLSSKNYRLQLTTFFQKFVIQVLVLAIRSDSKALAWIIAIVGMSLGMMRLYELFLKLPLYHTKALSMQTCLLNIIISANFAHFINLVLKASESKAATASINFVITTWILLALLMNKISFEALKSLVLSLICADDQKFKNPEMFIHKVIFAKELEKNKKTPSVSVLTYDLHYLVLMQHNMNIEQTFGYLNLKECLPEQPESLRDLPKETRNKIYLQYYQELLKRYPRNFMLKLHIAFRSFKNSEPYAKTIQMINKIQGSEWSKDYLSSALLLKEIEESILAAGKNEEQSLDIFTYVKSRIMIDNVHSKMFEQADLQLNVCNNILKDVSDIGQIHSSAQRISTLKGMIKKETEKLSKVLPEYYISPFLSYAEYFLVLNYSVKSFDKYYELYTQRHNKIQKFLKDPNLMEENLYQSSNAFLLVSSQKADFGKILFYNHSLVNLCGGSNQSYHNTFILSMFSPSLRSYYESLFRQAEISLNKIHRVFIYNKDQHLVEADIYLRYHPYLTQGLCLDLVIRPVPVSDYNEFLLLKEDGEIEGASRKLSKLLGLKSLRSKTNSRIPIKTFSDELDLANTAFNLILKNNGGDTKDIKEAKMITESPTQSMTYEKAHEIYTAFTSEDQEINFHCENKDILAHRFHTQIQVIDYGSMTMKLVTLKAARVGQRDIFSVDDLKSAHTVAASENFEFEEFENSVPVSLPMRGQSLFSSQQPKMVDESRVENMNMASPTSTDLRHLMSPRSGKEKSARIRRNILVSDSNRYSESHTEANNNKTKYKKERVVKYLSSTASSTRSAEKVETKAYKMALLSKSYPKSFKLLCVAFYFVIIMTFAGQLIMKSVSDSTMENLQIRKNLLKYSEEKFYKGAIIQVTGRGLTLVLQAVIGDSGAYVAFATSIEDLQNRWGDMKRANDGMLDYVFKLDEATQNKLFSPDIRINGTYLDFMDGSSKFVSVFQIVGELGNAIKAAKYLNTSSPTYMTSIYNIVNYLLTSTVDDFLYKSVNVTAVLSDSVEEQKDSFQFITNLFLILNPFLLMGIGVLLVGIIWNQYRIEKRHMHAFIKLPSGRVQLTAERLAQFKLDLMNEEAFESKWASAAGQNIVSFADKIEKASAYSKKADTQKIKYDSFRERYQKYIIRVILCMSMLVVITIVDLIITQNSIKVIYNRQDQLQFANYISNRALITHLNFVELFITNNTLPVEHMYPLPGLTEKVEVIKQIQGEIPKRFLEVDGTYNPEVQDIIFKNNPTCEGFDDSWIHYCRTMVANGQPVNMLATISAFQQLVATKLQDYIDVDKSNFLFILGAATKGETPLTTAVVVCEEAHRIANIMDKSMTEKISEMKNTRILIIAIFSVGLLIVSILIWLYILKMIREVHNDFKKVLQILPSGLVLSSYLLKRFLQKSSNGLLR